MGLTVLPVNIDQSTRDASERFYLETDVLFGERLTTGASARDVIEFGQLRHVVEVETIAKHVRERRHPPGEADRSPRPPQRRFGYASSLCSKHSPHCK